MTIAPLSGSCVAHLPELDARVPKGAARRTKWHRSITSREAQVRRREAQPNPRDALAVPRASPVVRRASIALTSAPLRSTCAVITVACDSKVAAHAAIAPPRGARIEACASHGIPTGSIVAPPEAKRGSMALIVVSCAGGAEGRAAIGVGCPSIVSSRASLLPSRASRATASDARGRLPLTCLVLS